MSTRRVVSLAAVVAVAFCSSPSMAAKKKPAPITGTYGVTLVPDPTANVLSTAGRPGNCGLNPGAQNKHVFTVPAAGVLKLTIDAQDPKPGTPYVFDWDIFLLDAAGANLADGNSSEAHEEIAQKFKKGQQVTFLACNLNGVPNATVAYTFTYA